MFALCDQQGTSQGITNIYTPVASLFYPRTGETEVTIFKDLMLERDVLRALTNYIHNLKIIHIYIPV